MNTDDHEDPKSDDNQPPVAIRRSLQQMRIDAMASEGKNAWACPSCGCRDWRVSNVWYSGDAKKRLRKCRNCGTPATTVEKFEE